MLVYVLVLSLSPWYQSSLLQRVYRPKSEGIQTAEIRNSDPSHTWLCLRLNGHQLDSVSSGCQKQVFRKDLVMRMPTCEWTQGGCTSTLLVLSLPTVPKGKLKYIALPDFNDLQWSDCGTTFLGYWVLHFNWVMLEILFGKLLLFWHPDRHFWNISLFMPFGTQLKVGGKVVGICQSAVIFCSSC